MIKKSQSNAIKEFLEQSFENVCFTYLEYLSKNMMLDGLYTDFQNYNSKLNRSIEIDIVSRSDESLLIGEAKLSKNKRTIKDYYDMKEDTSIPPFSTFKDIDYYLFGTSGFDKKLIDLKDDKLHLIDLKTMFAVR